MNAITIGISLGLFAILFTTIYKGLDKPVFYGLVLSGIGCLYVGFTWTDIPSLAVTIFQAMVFLMLAHYGIKKNLTFMTAGYFLHGLWDLIYSQFDGPQLIPPHYDLFCMAIDFTMGLHLVFLQYKLSKVTLSDEAVSA
jgi:hypothetical protein